MVIVVVSMSCGIRPSSLRWSRRSVSVSENPHTGLPCSLSKNVLNWRGG